jgi:hypothetical protein
MGATAEMQYTVYDEHDTRVLTVARHRTDSTAVLFVHPPDPDGTTHVIYTHVPPPPIPVAQRIAHAAIIEAGGWTTGAVNTILRDAERIVPGCRVEVFDGEVPDVDGPML